MKTLTDLEAAALGCIWRARGCTAYAVRSSFRSSPTSRFSGSAGAVYPMLQRLERRGWLRSRHEPSGRRPAEIYECTRAGLAALRRWLDVPKDDGDLPAWDPLRTRALYLGLLSPAARSRWLDQAEQAMKAHASHIRKILDETDPENTWLRLAHRNTLYLARARSRWLRDVRRVLEHEPPSHPPRSA